ncbi:MAG TPA: lysylphosphatidylglycerol synthase domain-containing protein, partial [Stellaceae bacterium]|nr:lysylphosphatidylglycerol synthase domain-containing protein [Stellaceae bacterium]
VLALLLVEHDARDVLAAVAALGWWLALLVAFHAVPLLIDAIAWRALIEPLRLRTLVAIRWIGEGVNGVLPVPHLGEILRAGLAARHVGGRLAAASVVVDVTLGVATQAVFTAIGLALLSLLANDGVVLRSLLLAAAILVASATAFYGLQRAGGFRLAALLAHRWSKAARRTFGVADAQAIDDQVRALYGRRRPLLRSAAWRLAGWIAGAGEIWIALRGLGHPIGLGDAVMLESLSQAARTAAFAIPGGLGVQDGALLVLGAQIGIGGDTALALALAKRCRELVLGVPAAAAASFIQTRSPAANGSPGAPPTA